MFVGVEPAFNAVCSFLIESVFEFAGLVASLAQEKKKAKLQMFSICFIWFFIICCNVPFYINYTPVMSLFSIE